MATVEECIAKLALVGVERKTSEGICYRAMVKSKVLEDQGVRFKTFESELASPETLSALTPEQKELALEWLKITRGAKSSDEMLIEKIEGETLIEAHPLDTFWDEKRKAFAGDSSVPMAKCLANCETSSDPDSG